MEKRKETGGPAFPMPHQDIDMNGEFAKFGNPGMTLRQYYKAHTLTGILSNVQLMKAVCDENTDGVKVAERVSTLAGLYADKMIQEDIK